MGRRFYKPPMVDYRFFMAEVGFFLFTPCQRCNKAADFRIYWYGAFFFLAKRSGYGDGF